MSSGEPSGANTPQTTTRRAAAVAVLVPALVLVLWGAWFLSRSEGEAAGAPPADEDAAREEAEVSDEDAKRVDVPLSGDTGPRTVVHEPAVVCSPPAEVATEQLWLENELVQQSLANVQEAIEPTRDAIIGSFIDDASRSLVIVYSPDRAALVPELKRAAGEALASAPEDLARERALDDLGPLDENERKVLLQPGGHTPPAFGDGALTVVLRPGCRPIDDIDALRAIVEAGAWLEQPDATYTVTVDPATGQVVLGLAADDLHLADDLQAEHGDALRVEAGTINLYSGRS